MTSMQRCHVASTSFRRHVPAGNLPPPPLAPQYSKPWPPQYSKPSYAYVSGVYFSASDEVVVYGTNVEQYSNDAFLAFPVDVLGNDYYTVSHYPSTMECEFMLVGVYDSTNVNITLGTHFAIDVEYNGVHYYNRSVMSVSLDRLETFQVILIFCINRHVLPDRISILLSLYVDNQLTKDYFGRWSESHPSDRVHK